MSDPWFVLGAMKLKKGLFRGGSVWTVEASLSPNRFSPE
jgi:hypothetical protein